MFCTLSTCTSDDYITVHMVVVPADACEWVGVLGWLCDQHVLHMHQDQRKSCNAGRLKSIEMASLSDDHSFWLPTRHPSLKEISNCKKQDRVFKNLAKSIHQVLYYWCTGVLLVSIEVTFTVVAFCRTTISHMSPALKFWIDKVSVEEFARTKTGSKSYNVPEKNTS